MNPILTLNFKAGAAITGYRIVKHGADDQAVLQGAAEGDAVFGVAESLDVAIDKRVDVIVAGVANVRYGAAVARGDLLESDANGKAIPAAVIAGTNIRTIGVAMKSGALDDIGEVLIQPGSFQG